MEILEFGNKSNNKIVLIHGFQSPYQVWKEYINYYEPYFQIIVQVLDGHSQSEKEDYVSFDKMVLELENYLINNHGNNIFCVYGMSMGGIVACKLFENGKINISNLILDGTPVVSYSNFLNNKMKKKYIKLSDKIRSRDKKTMDKACKSIITRDKLDYFCKVIDNMSNEVIVKYLDEVCKYQLKNDVSSYSQIYYYHGTKMNEHLSKKSAKFIKKNYSNSSIICFKGKGHCENSLLNSKVMITELDKILMKR